MYQDYVSQGFSAVAIAKNETEEQVRSFQEQSGCSFPFVWDAMPPTIDAFSWPQAISPYPRQAVIGKDGTLKYLNSEWDNAALRAAIESALAESFN